MPVVACLPMTAAVVGARHLLEGFHLPALVNLLVEIGVGGVAYLAAAWVVANPTVRDVLDLAKRAVKRRRS
jgi:hypothetical protein